MNIPLTFRVPYGCAISRGGPPFVAEKAFGCHCAHGEDRSFLPHESLDQERSSNDLCNALIVDTHHRVAASERQRPMANQGGSDNSSSKLVRRSCALLILSAPAQR